MEDVSDGYNIPHECDIPRAYDIPGGGCTMLPVSPLACALARHAVSRYRKELLLSSAYYNERYFPSVVQPRTFHPWVFTIMAATCSGRELVEPTAS